MTNFLPQSKWSSFSLTHLFTGIHTILTEYCDIDTKFGQLLLREIFEIVATRCQMLRLKCVKFDIRWGSGPDSAVETFSALSNPIAGIKRPTPKGYRYEIWPIASEGNL